MTCYPIVDARVLGQLLLMQSVLATLPDCSVMPFVVQGLSDIPGVERVMFDPGDVDDDPLRFRLASRSSLFGQLSFRLSDESAFAPYVDHVRNFTVLLGVILEERRQRAEITRTKIYLEEQIAERTAELSHERDTVAGLLAEKEAILENALVGIVMMRHRQIISCNQRFEEIFGYSPGTMTGQSARILYSSAEIYETLGMQSYPTIGRSTCFTATLKMVRADGREFWGEVTGRAIDPACPQEGSIWIYSDITERKQAEDNLHRKNEALERSNAELESYAYAASHDLREPLRNITTFSTILSRKLEGRLENDERDLFKIISDAANRMNSLILDLLDVSRAGQGEMDHHTVDLSKLVPTALNGLRTQIETTGAKVEVDSRLPEVKGNENELYRVFMNIIGNALKYRRDDPPMVRINCEAEGETLWRIGICDNGIGIETGQSYEERIFGLFQRLHPATAYGGSGAGLAICRRLIELLGGRIWAESEPGHGSAFHFTVAKA